MSEELLSLPLSRADLRRLPPILGRVCALEEDLHRQVGWQPVAPMLLTLGTAEGRAADVCEGGELVPWLAVVAERLRARRAAGRGDGVDFAEVVVLVLQPPGVGGRLLSGCVAAGGFFMLERVVGQEPTLLWAPDGAPADAGGGTREVAAALRRVIEIRNG